MTPRKANPHVPPSTIDRLLARCHEDGAGCWLWAGYVSAAGYARIRSKEERREVQGHRVAYEHFRGEIPTGLQLDHLCRVRRCVNPWHLEPVTNRVNTMRGDAMKNGRHNAVKTHCPRGHEYAPENTIRYASDGRRQCRTCQRAASRESMRKLRARKAAS